MSDIAKLHFVLALFVCTLAAVVFLQWPIPEPEIASALASPYCTERGAHLSLIAKAAYAKDLATGETIYAENENAQLPLASLTKLMTVLTASSFLKEDDTVTITRDALVPEGGDIHEGDVWRALDLMDYTLITSDNDGAHALGLAASEKTGGSFSELMNTKASDVGLTQTYFTNDTGLDFSESVAAAYGSAYDMALLLHYLVTKEPRRIEATTLREKIFTTVNGRTYVAENTSSVISGLNGAVASKTGFTDLAGGNLGIVFEPVLGHPVVAVVLGSTRDGRETDIQTLADYAKRWITRDILCGSNGT